MVADAETRAANLLKGVGTSSSLIRGTCVQKSQKSATVRESPPKVLFSVRVICPPKPTPGIGEEGVCSPQAFMRYMPPSSTEVRLVEALRSCFVAGSGKRDRKSALPFALPFRYSRLVECGEDLEPSLDSGVVAPHFAYVFQSLVV